MRMNERNYLELILKKKMFAKKNNNSNFNNDGMTMLTELLERLPTTNKAKQLTMRTFWAFFSFFKKLL